ncbi:hypothetical protein [Marinovum sp.]|uniref:hypothetical protein n=1 Tax=Marinovum sp. TaxID=2024839 RepID=UPI002B26EAD3|nr:hypothetical protein [Marinovum sp.]
MVQHIEIPAEAGPSQIRWRGPESSNRLDCETGVLLRATLSPVFQQATSWTALRRKLARKGFGLGFHQGRLVLTDRQSGERICSCKYLGHPLRALSDRLGRAKVLASTDGRGRGTLLA